MAVGPYWHQHEHHCMHASPSANAGRDVSEGSCDSGKHCHQACQEAPAARDKGEAGKLQDAESCLQFSGDHNCSICDFYAQAQVKFDFPPDLISGHLISLPVEQTVPIFSRRPISHHARGPPCPV